MSVFSCAGSAPVMSSFYSSTAGPKHRDREDSVINRKAVGPWPLHLEKKLLEIWNEVKHSEDPTVTSDVMRRKILLERLVRYDSRLKESCQWEPLADFTNKQLKNKIEALMKKGKIEIRKFIAPLLSAQAERRAEEAGEPADREGDEVPVDIDWNKLAVVCRWPHLKTYWELFANHPVHGLGGAIEAGGPGDEIVTHDREESHEYEAYAMSSPEGSAFASDHDQEEEVVVHLRFNNSEEEEEGHGNGAGLIPGHVSLRQIPLPVKVTTVDSDNDDSDNPVEPGAFTSTKRKKDKQCARVTKVRKINADREEENVAGDQAHMLQQEEVRIGQSPGWKTTVHQEFLQAFIIAQKELQRDRLEFLDEQRLKQERFDDQMRRRHEEHSAALQDRAERSAADLLERAERSQARLQEQFVATQQSLQQAHLQMQVTMTQQMMTFQATLMKNLFGQKDG